MKNISNMPHPWPLKKDYGEQAPVEPLLSRLLDKHGPKIGAALCALSACLVVAGCLMAFWLLLPHAIGAEIDLSRAVVAESRGRALSDLRGNK